MIVAQPKNCWSAIVGPGVSQGCWCLSFSSTVIHKSLSPWMSTPSTAVRLKSRMTEITSSEVLIVPCSGAACCQFQVMLDGIRAVWIPWSLLLPILHILGSVYVDLVSVLSWDAVVDGLRAVGGTTWGGRIVTCYLNWIIAFEALLGVEGQPGKGVGLLALPHSLLDFSIAFALPHMESILLFWLLSG